MKLKYSLRQASWAIIFIAVILPSMTIMVLYGVKIYKDSLHTALIIKHHRNEVLAHDFEAKIQQLKAILENKSDALAFQIDNIENHAALIQINELLKKIVQRDTLIHEVMLLSDNLDLIDIIEPDKGIFGDKLLSIPQLKALKKDKNLELQFQQPAIAVPLQGKAYIGDVTIEDKEIEDFIFSISVPVTVNSEIKGVLIAYIRVDSIWSITSFDDLNHKQSMDTVNYIINDENILLTVDKFSDYQKVINKMGLVVDSSIYKLKKTENYIGLNNKLVYGIKTTIPSLKWVLISEVEASKITQMVLLPFVKMFFLTLFFISIVMKVVFVLVKKILIPIQNACHVINQVAHGNYDYSLKATEIIELDKLNSDIKFMVHERQNAEYDLQEKYQLQAQENELREMLDSMVVAVMCIDTSGCILSANAAAEQMFGYSKEEMMVMSINKLIPDSIAHKHDGYLKSYLETGQSHIIGVGRDLYGKNKQNNLFPMRLLVAELPKNADGEMRFIGSCIDLTDFKKRESQFQRAEKMDALGRLTGGIAHDFNNMLGIILGYTQLLSQAIEKTQDAKLIEYVDEIKKAGERGADLTQNLMSFVRQKTTNLIYLDVNELLLSEYDMLKRLVTVRVKIILNLAKNIWKIKVEKNSLEDAIINLVINADYAMKKTTTAAKLTITSKNKILSQHEADVLNLKTEEYVVLSFLDSGMGIEESMLDNIFDPFYTSKGSKGTGLGLSQVYTFVKNFNGAIEVVSQKGWGSQFTLYFPRATDNNDNVKAQSSDKSENVNLLGSESILIVDDELAKLTQELLKNQGYNVYISNRAKTALEILKNESIDLMLSDIIMPEMDGYQLSAIVQKQYPHIKIQLISGYNDDKNAELVNKNLSDNLILKPFDSVTLFKRIRKLLDESNQLSLEKMDHSDEKLMVDFVEWHDDYNIDISKIDSDHKQLLSLINACIDMQNNNIPKQKGKSLLKQLFEESSEHFLQEEKLLEISGYPFLSKHKMIHQLFLQRIIQFQKDYEVDSLSLDSLLQFLIDWHQHHMTGMDKEAFAYAKKTNLLDGLGDIDD